MLLAWLQGSFGATLAGEVADSRGVSGGGLPADLGGQVGFRASRLQNCTLEQILGGGKRSRQDGGSALWGHSLALELVNAHLPWHCLKAVL